MPDMYKCDYCGKLFVPHSSTLAKYKRGEQKSLACSRECANKLKRNGKYVKCDNCGVEIYRTSYRLNLREHQFCSLKCEKEFQYKETYEIRKCEICGKEFECSKISTQRFCSMQCQSKWQSTQIGILNPKFQGIKSNCDYCGNNIFVSPYKLKLNTHNFCNEKCRQNWYAEIWSQTDEWKEKSRIRATKIISDGLIPFVFTKPQIIVNEILEELSINYENDYNIKYYAIDNYLNDYNLMIEVMGDYWHSNPCIFEYSDLNDIQLKRIPHDKSKHTYTKNKYDIEILYLWESDIIKNRKLCLKLIKKYIDSNGIMSNYHSFNYYLNNDKLSIINEIILPYQDYDCVKVS